MRVDQIMTVEEMLPQQLGSLALVLEDGLPSLYERRNLWYKGRSHRPKRQTPKGSLPLRELVCT
jgi:hypothetical protein